MKKYLRSGLRNDDALKILDDIVSFMESEKPYVNPEFSLQILSDQLNISKHYISQVLNQILNKNFYTFVSEYRIKEFKKLTIDPEFQHYTIMSLAFESGFNSKTSFNMIFKKYENRTPSEYLKEVSVRVL